MEKKSIIDSINNALQAENIKDLTTYEHAKGFKCLISKTLYASEELVRQLLRFLKELLIFGRFFREHEQDIIDFGGMDYYKTRDRVINFIFNLFENCTFLPVCTLFWEDLILKLINEEIDHDYSSFLIMVFDERMGFASPHVLGYTPEEILNHSQEKVIQCLDIYVDIQQQVCYLEEDLIYKSRQQKWILDQLLFERVTGTPQEYIASFNHMFKSLSAFLNLVSLEYEEFLFYLIDNPQEKFSHTECSSLVQWALWIRKHTFQDEDYKTKIIHSISSTPQEIFLQTTPGQESGATSFLDMWLLLAEYYEGIKILYIHDLLIILNSIIKYGVKDQLCIDSIDKLVFRGYQLNRFPSDILIHLFVKHETPHWFHKHFFHSTTFEREAFFHMAKGQSLRFLHGIPGGISRKEAYFLGQIPHSLVPNNYVENWMMLGGFFAKLMANGCESDILGPLKRHSWQISQLLQYPGMVEELANFLLKHKDEWHFRLDFGETMDYISFKKQENPDYSLKSRSYRAIRNQSDRWHTWITSQRERNISPKKWNPVMIRDFRAELDNNTFQINQITGILNLYAEGTELNHCVSSYASQCINGSTAIFSLNQEKDGRESKKLVTLQVSNRTIIQAKGRCNRNMNETERKLVQRWADQQGLMLAV